MQAPESPDLTGSFLIAMPAMADRRFERAVIFLCAHSEDAAMGLIVNKPLPGTRMTALMAQLGIAPVPERLHATVQFGGPVEMARGFVLHSPDWQAEDGTVEVNAEMAMTGTLDILREMAAGRGPERAILALGYAGWGPGQLEGELAQNAWLTVKASARIVFETPNERKWEAALGLLGIDPTFLSADSGRA